MNPLIKHAKKEFEILGWDKLEGADGEMQKMVCDNLLELLQAFSNQGHSGSSAPYIIAKFERLARFDPLSPLTGNADEWRDVSAISGEPHWQNLRDSEVFKDMNGAYWIRGKIFKDKAGVPYTNHKSRVPVTFPWTKPEPEIVDG